MRLLLAVIALVFSSSPAALAQSQSQSREASPIVVVAESPPPTSPRPRVSLTFSPLFAAVPMGEVSVEVRVRDKVGIGAMAGVGWFTFGESPVKTHLLLYQVGAQGRYYVLGNFHHGMLLAAQVAYFRTASPFRDQIRLSSNAFALAPSVGYKYTMEVGFTFEVQLGYEFLLARGNLDNEAIRAGASFVLFDIHIGWSF